MNKFVFVVLCALLVGEVLGEAALGNYYKDVVREQHELINEMNQNFTELEKASEKLIDLGLYVGKHKLPPKTIKITKTVAVKVPVPFPVKVPEPVPVPVPVSKPVPVPVPTLVAIPIESTAATVAAVTVTGSGSTSGPTPSSSVVPVDADPASSQVHPSTVQVQEYVQSFPIHSVYDAGDDYNPMEGNRLALAEHTATPTESTFGKPSPSSLQQLEEYQQHQYHQRHQHHQHATGHHPQQPKHHQRHPAQAGSLTSAEQYYGGHGGSGSVGGSSAGGQRQYHVSGAQVQAGAHSAAKYRPEPHAHQPTAESYDFGSGVVHQYDPTSYARATDTPYTAAAGNTGGKPAPSAPSGISEGYHYPSDQEQRQHQQQQQFQRGNHGGESIFESEQFGGVVGGGSGGRIGGTEIGGAGGVAGAGSVAEASAHSYVKFRESAALQQADHQATTVPRFEGQGEAELQTPLQAGFEAGLQAALQTSLQAGFQTTREAELKAEQDAEKGAHRHGAGGKAKEINDLTPRPFQLARDTYPRYEKPDFARYNADQSSRHHNPNRHHHHHHHHHQETEHLQQGGARGGDSSGSVLPEGYDYASFAKSNGPAAGESASGAVPATETHGYTVPGERPPKVSTASYHHSHPHSKDVSGQTHKGVRHQAVDAGADPFPFYHATRNDPHLVRAGLKPHHANAAPGGPSYQLQQQFGEHAESPTGGSSGAPALHHNFHHHHHILVGGYDPHAEHQHHDQFGQKHQGSYDSAKPTVYSVPSDAHLYPGYNAAADHDNHGTNHGAGSNNHHGAGTSGKFHYHFHNVHPIGGGADHQLAASELQYHAVDTEPGRQYGGAAGPDGSRLTSYDPPASGSTFHFHDDGTGDMFAGASDVQEQIRAPYEEHASYGNTH